MRASYEERVTHVVVGAGFQGLPIVKKLRDLGEEVLCLDRNPDVGGIWHTGAYETAHIISSRFSTGFTDFPMPESFPDFPSKAEMQRYFRSYAEHFGLLEHIRLNTEVLRVSPLPANGVDEPRWRTECAGGRVVFSHTVTIANGHHTEPLTADYPGTFAGQMTGSSEYRTPDLFEGKRVLVVGSGNTACDAAVDASLHGLSADISIRDGVYSFPRTFMGKPFDTLMRSLPIKAEWLERLVGWVVHKAAVGDPRHYGMPKPQFRIFDQHPVINSELLRRIKLGEVGVRPEIERFDGHRVVFKDGSSREYDMVFWAIGYRIGFPLLRPEDQLLDWDGRLPVMFLQLASPKHRGLFIAGLGQARTGGGPLFELGGYLTARMATFDARQGQSVTAAIAAHPEIRFAQRWLGLKLVDKADMRSRSLQEHTKAGAGLARVLDAIGASDAPRRVGVSQAISTLDLEARATRVAA